MHIQSYLPLLDWKTFTALAVIKYYENRNKSVLVLCPKKLCENWNTYKDNYVNKQGSNPLDGIIRKEMHETLSAGLKTLDEDDSKFLLELFFVWEGNVKANAEKLDVPRETVRDRRNRILRRLKKYFEKNGFFDATFGETVPIYLTGANTSDVL